MTVTALDDVMSLPTVDVRAIAPLGRDEKIRLAENAYRQLAELIASFDKDEWSRPTDCPDWDVQAMVCHVLGAMEANASVRENVHQFRLGRRWAKRTNRPLIDEINAVQVTERKMLTPDELVARVRQRWPRALRGRFKVPTLVGRLVRMPVDAPGLKEFVTLGNLLDVVYTRDTWIHGVDLSRATGREFAIISEHDRRLVADVVADWARRHGHPFTLVLSGPAGATYVSGSTGETLHLDAVEFCRIVSGRAPGSGLLAQKVLF